MSRMNAQSKDDVENRNQEKMEISSDDEGKVEGKDEGESGYNRGKWTAAEDAMLAEFVEKNGEGNWRDVEKMSGLSRSRDACRTRWMNHLRSGLKKCALTDEEKCRIVQLHAKHGNKWSVIAAELTGRTNEDVRNFWKVRRSKLLHAGEPIYPPGIIPTYSTGRVGFDAPNPCTSGSSSLGLQKEGAFNIPFPNLDAGKIARHYSLLGFPPALLQTPSFRLPEGNSPYDSYNLSLPSEHHPELLQQTRTSSPFVNAGEMNEIPSVGQYFYSPVIIDEPPAVPPPQSMVDPSRSTSWFGQALSDVVPDSHSIGNYGNDLSSESMFVAPKMELSSLRYTDACASSQSTLSPFAPAARPHCLIRSPPFYPCQPAHLTSSDVTGLLEVDKESFPRLEKGRSQQMADVSSGFIPTMDANQSSSSPPGGNASFIPNTSEENQSFDIDLEAVVRFLKESEDWVKSPNENEKTNDKENSRPDG